MAELKKYKDLTGEIEKTEKKLLDLKKERLKQKEKVPIEQLFSDYNDRNNIAVKNYMNDKTGDKCLIIKSEQLRKDLDEIKEQMDAGLFFFSYDFKK